MVKPPMIVPDLVLILEASVNTLEHLSTLLVFVSTLGVKTLGG